MKIVKLFSVFKVNILFIIFIIACSLTGYFTEAALFSMFVFLHEMCHVAAAYFYNINIKNIELFPFGGVARVGSLEYMGITKEIVISAAGPMFNMAAAVFLLLLNKLGAKVPNIDIMITINVTLALFNLLPGFPLDGGRILRAILEHYTGFRSATGIAALSGRIIAAILFLIGISLILYNRFNISFFIMPFFMLYAAGQEENATIFMILKDVISKRERIKNEGCMKAGLLCAYKDTYVGDILKHADLNRYHIIFVIDEEMAVSGILTESQVIENLAPGGDTTIGHINEIIKSEK